MYISFQCRGKFESSVNLYGGQTEVDYRNVCFWFESSVNLYGGQTKMCTSQPVPPFESSVNLYGGQTTGLAGISST